MRAEVGEFDATWTFPEWWSPGIGDVVQSRAGLVFRVRASGLAQAQSAIRLEESDFPPTPSQLP